jgi:hypothetical protein
MTRGGRSTAYAPGSSRNTYESDGYPPSNRRKRARSQCLVCSGNRGGSIVPTVRSILGNEHASFEPVVVDQSSNDDTARPIAQFSEDPRLRCVRSMRRPFRRHNVGLSHAWADIAAMTDHTWEVDSNWMQEIAAVFAQIRRPQSATVAAVPGSGRSQAGFRALLRAVERPADDSIARLLCTNGIGVGLAVQPQSADRERRFANLLDSYRSRLLFRLRSSA